MGYLGATLTQVFTCARSRRVSQRCHNSSDGKRPYRVRVTSRIRSVRRILGILKKSVSWVESCLGRRQLAFAYSPKPGQWPLWWVSHDMGVGSRSKSQNRKNMYLSHVEEPLNSKVIKSFVPELRSRKCFCLSGFLCSMYICYEHLMYVSHIAISGYGTPGVVANMQDCNTIVSIFEFLSCIPFTFRLISLRKVLIPYLLAMGYHYCPTIMMDLALNNPWRFTCHLAKKPN